MILQALAFYVFAAITVAAAAMVVVSRNPVYSVLFLILAFFNGAGLFILLGAEINVVTDGRRTGPRPHAGDVARPEREPRSP
jgi:NADH:ubiquinone oxidoreductase subunit 6 (subunit J)